MLLSIKGVLEFRDLGALCGGGEDDEIEVGSVRDRRISEPGAVAQLEDAIVELVISDMRQDPFQACKNGSAVGLAQCDHDDSEVVVEQMRDGMEEIPIRGEQYGSKVLGFLEHYGIVNPLITGSAKIEDAMPGTFEECDCRRREILVEQELHATAS